MKFFSSLTIAILFIFSATAQSHNNKCKTSELYEANIKANPSLLQARQQLEAFTQQWSKEYENGQLKTTAAITLPVVVHVLYRNTAQNISDAQIQSQIDVLNKDFRKLNTDFSTTPLAFQLVAADVEVNFCLATKDPNGNPSSGITRTQTTVAEIGNTNKYHSTANGGMTAWDVSKYINIWVCDVGTSGLLGFATIPNSAWPPNSDGLVIGYRYFGTTGAVTFPFNKGRTTTHEMGHYFNLEHIWGPGSGGCLQDDFVNDTPLQFEETNVCATFPKLDICTNSGNGIMYCNYLDYVNDACMTMFTNGQKIRMLAALNGARSGLANNGAACLWPTDVTNSDLTNAITIYPNPAMNAFTITSTATGAISLRLYNTMGQKVIEQYIDAGTQINVSQLPSGIYYLNFVNDKNQQASKKIVITH